MLNYQRVYRSKKRGPTTQRMIRIGPNVYSICFRENLSTAPTCIKPEEFRNSKKKEVNRPNKKVSRFAGVFLVVLGSADIFVCIFFTN